MSCRLLACACAVVLPLAAQNPVVSGRVTDPSDAVVPGARIEIANRTTGIRNTAVSNAEGYYVLPPQPPGVYDFLCSAAGFSATRLEAVTLEVGQSRTVNFALRPGEVRESVTVTDVAPLLTTNRPDRGAVVENKFVTSIPLNLRNPMLLLTLVPGVTTGLNAGLNLRSQSTTNNFRINGGRGSTSEVLIDGAANTVSYNNQVAAIPQVDAIQEFKVNTSPYAAEFGRTGGGVVSFSIRSGTNTLHGSMHEFLRNSVLDANGFNANRAGQPRPAFRRNQFGFTAGGPVWIPKLYNGRNRTFFFVGYEGLREKSLRNFTGTMPTDLERQGDFSRSLDTNGTLLRIFDPRTTRLDPDRPAGATRYLRDQYPGNRISSNLFSPIAVNFLTYYPKPNQAGRGLSNFDNYFLASANSLDANRVDLRIDHQVATKHAVFFRYNWFQNLNAEPLVYGHAGSPIQTPNRIPGINWIANHTWTASPGNIVEQHFSVAHSETNRTPLTLNFDQTTLGFPKSVADGQRVKYFPRLTVGRMGALGPEPTGSNKAVPITYQYAVSLTTLKGRHTIKSGFDWRWYTARVDTSPGLQLSAGGSFTGGPNPLAAAGASGHGLADLLLGVASVSYQFRPIEDYRHPYYAWFVQDEFRLSRKITLSYGLRYTLELPRSEKSNEYVFLDLDSPSPLRDKVAAFPNLRGGVGFPGIEGRSSRIQLSDRNNFDPRFGIAYQWDEKTVVRAGAGIFRHPHPPGPDTAIGFSSTTDSIVAAPDGVTPLYNLGDPFPQGIQKPTGNSLGLLTFVGLGISGSVRQQRLAYQGQWSLDVQRQLPGSFVLDAGYAGTNGVALSASRVQFNQLPMEYLSLGTALNQTVPNPFFGVITDPSSTLSRSTVQRGQLLRPYPQFTGASSPFVPVGHSSYHSLQVRVERRFSQGLAILLAYTHSKLIDNVADMAGQFGIAPGMNNSYCYSCDRSLSFYDLPNILRFSYRYELPMGVGKPYLSRGWMARVIGGWSVAGFVTAESGIPTAVSSPNDTNSLGGGGNQRPNATGQKARLDGARQYVDGARYFNSAAFVRTPPYAFGNVSRTLPDVRNPGPFNWDLLVEKRIAITERAGLDFRTELFNVPNHVIFRGPNTSVTSADFGLIRLNQENTPRQIQFGLRLSF